MTTNRCTNGDAAMHGIPTRAPVRVTLLERIVLGMLAAFVLGCCVLVTWSRLAEVLA